MRQRLDIGWPQNAIISPGCLLPIHKMGLKPYLPSSVFTGKAKFGGYPGESSSAVTMRLIMIWWVLPKSAISSGLNAPFR